MGKEGHPQLSGHAGEPVGIAIVLQTKLTTWACDGAWYCTPRHGRQNFVGTDTESFSSIHEISSFL